MSEAKYYGVTKDGKHLLKNIATGQIEIYETEEEAKLETHVSIGHIMPIYISKKDQQATIDKLVEGLRNSASQIVFFASEEDKEYAEQVQDNFLSIADKHDQRIKDSDDD